MSTVIVVLTVLALALLATGWWVGVFSFSVERAPVTTVTHETHPAVEDPDNEGWEGAASRTPLDADARTILLPEDAVAFALRKDRELQTTGNATRISVPTMSCECDDFRTRRAHLHARDVRRLCRHLQGRLLDIGVQRTLPEYLGVLLRNPYLERCDRLHVENVFGHEVVFTREFGSPWVNVIVRKRRRRDTPAAFTGDYGRYGFNLNQSRWSWGEGPDGARELRRRIASLSNDRA